MFALLYASLNYGHQVSNYGGALVLQQLGVTPNGSMNEDPGQHEALPIVRNSGLCESRLGRRSRLALLGSGGA
eukprot:5819766-Amphidinium_carterae.2